MNRTTKIKKPSFFIYYIIGPIVCLFIRIKYKVKLKRSKIKKGSIIVCPHRSYFDCILAAFALYPYRANIVATTLWYRNKFLGKLFNALGVIPKDQFKNDVIAIKNIVSSLKKGRNVLIFAEGQMSVFGDSINLPHGLDKLVAKFKPNLYFITSKGAYFSSNRWNMSFERGTFESEVKILMDNEKPEEYKEEIINSRLKEEYDKSNDFKYLDLNEKFKIKKKDISSGLSHILFKCPNCHEELPFDDSNNKLVCKECGYTLEFEKNSYMFKPNNDFKHLGQLFDYERKEYNAFASKENFMLEDEVEVSYYDDEFVKHELGDYNLKLDKNAFTLKNDKETIVCPIDKLVNIVMNFNKGVELPTEEHTYICNFKDPKRVFEYWNFVNR